MMVFIADADVIVSHVIVMLLTIALIGGAERARRMITRKERHP